MEEEGECDESEWEWDGDAYLAAADPASDDDEQPEPEWRRVSEPGLAEIRRVVGFTHGDERDKSEYHCECEFERVSGRCGEFRDGALPD